MAETPRYLEIFANSIDEAEVKSLRNKIDSLKRLLADRELELLKLKGPCSNNRCNLHYAHSGPCNISGR